MSIGPSHACGGYKEERHTGICTGNLSNCILPKNNSSMDTITAPNEQKQQQQKTRASGAEAQRLKGGAAHQVLNSPNVEETIGKISNTSHMNTDS